MRILLSFLFISISFISLHAQDVFDVVKKIKEDHAEQQILIDYNDYLFDYLEQEIRLKAEEYPLTCYLVSERNPKGYEIDIKNEKSERLDFEFPVVQNINGNYVYKFTIDNQEKYPKELLHFSIATNRIAGLDVHFLVFL